MGRFKTRQLTQGSRREEKVTKTNPFWLIHQTSGRTSSLSIKKLLRLSNKPAVLFGEGKHRSLKKPAPWLNKYLLFVQSEIKKLLHDRAFIFPVN